MSTKEQTVVTTSAISKFKIIPSRIICLIVTCPVPKAIALGAVATGSINAQLAEIAAGTINHSIGISIASAVDARTGINKVVVATLEVSSVRNVIARQMLNTISAGGR